MKKLSDYKDEEAIDLWVDLLEPLSKIFKDPDVLKVVGLKKSPMEIARTILKNCKKEAKEILLRIDPEPLTGLNIVTRLVNVLADIGQSEEFKPFFDFAEQAKIINVSSISATENTEDNAE